MPLVPMCLLASLCLGAPVEVAWNSARLTLDESGRVRGLRAADGTEWAVPGEPFCRVLSERTVRLPQTLTREGDKLVFGFAGGGKLVWQVTSGEGFSLWRLADSSGLGEPDQVELAQLTVDGLPTCGATINAAYSETYAVALMPAALPVQPLLQRRANGGDNKPGVTHTFRAVTDEVKQGHYAAEFSAESTRDTSDGWSVRYHRFDAPQNLAGLQALRLWVRGDGRGELLKVQLHDSAGGVRDDYIPITFTGWREVTCDKPALNRLDPTKVVSLAFYYNGLPAKQAARCRLDDLRAVLPHGERPLETFEDPASDLWDGRGVRLSCRTVRRYGHTGAAFGLIACPRAEFTGAIAAFEVAAGLPSPRLGGKWAKESDWVKRSYLFITSFGAKDADEVIQWAHRGGLPMVLIGDGSWDGPAGHYPVNEQRFPGGLPALEQTVAQMRAGGLRVGLHYLAPAVYGNDSYVTPKPDARLYKGASANLAADVDAQTTDLPVTATPEGFPDQDGGYEGHGTVVQIDDELIQYGVRRAAAPFGLGACTRGAFGTKAAAHRAGAPVRHVVRSYGYFLFDLDSTLAGEVIGNVARVANAIRADMLYMDGSERLQGDHWYYNGKLQGLYWSNLTNHSTLMQGSSHSPYSWHLISRNASADGHGDVKGYLDERLPTFAWFRANLMPIDCGWYYVYDPQVTSDQYDYILQKCLGWDASISVQTNPANLRRHPEVGRIFDLVNLYERLRLSGLVPEEVKEKLREPKREYRTLNDPLRLRRTVYGQWQELSGEAEPPLENLQAAAAGARLGLEVRCGPRVAPGSSYRAAQSVTLETFDDLSPFLGTAQKDVDVFVVGPDKAGSVKQGVTQRLEAVEGAKEGRRCARYTAVSERHDDTGYSAIGRAFEPALDLSAAQVIGLWLKGDGQGGKFKLQLRDRANSAADYYVTNDFTQWRFLQLRNPYVSGAPTFDWAHLTHLLLYYNALPRSKTVSILIDDIRAQPVFDPSELAGFGVEVAGRRQMLNVKLLEGERYIGLPGESGAVVPAELAPRRLAPNLEAISLASTQPVRFVTDGPAQAAVSLRWVQDLPEEIRLPEAALKTPLPPLP